MSCRRSTSLSRSPSPLVKKRREDTSDLDHKSPSRQSVSSKPKLNERDKRSGNDGSSYNKNWSPTKEKFVGDNDAKEERTRRSEHRSSKERDSNKIVRKDGGKDSHGERRVDRERKRSGSKLDRGADESKRYSEQHRKDWHRRDDRGRGFNQSRGRESDWRSGKKRDYRRESAFPNDKQYPPSSSDRPKSRTLHNRKRSPADDPAEEGRPVWATRAVVKRAEEIQQRKLLWNKATGDSETAESMSTQQSSSNTRPSSVSAWNSMLAAASSDSKQIDKFKRYCLHFLGTTRYFLYTQAFFDGAF
ncbi:hypothetical protein AB6A40_002261 [Gnathostoma spinigerum]|uniref:Uncharacterized protein n=1 Tax=Gnathostoma spinigerum TaxID=75299 RepID=A0ABD6E8C8_9BILA